MIRLYHFARYAGLLGLVGLAAGLSALRYGVLPQVDQYRSDLQTQIAAHLQRPVRVGGLSARMQGLNPTITLKDVAVLQADGAVAVWLGQIEVGLNVQHWLTHGEWQTASITLQGADLTLRRHADGTLSLDGIPSTSGGLPPWLFEYGHFQLRHARFTWLDEPLQTALRLVDVNFGIANAPDQHLISASAALAGHLEQRIKAVVRLDGDIEQAAQSNGRAYLETTQWRVEDWPALEGFTYALRAGRWDGHAWLDWQAGQAQRLVATVALRNGIIEQGEGSANAAVLNVPQLGTRLNWQRQADGWRLDLSDLNVNVSGTAWPVGRASLAYQNNGPQWRLAGDYVRLDDVALAAQALVPAAQPWLDGWGWRGELSQFSALWDSGASGDQARLGGCAHLSDFGFNASGNRPGLSGLSLEGCGNDRAATAHLHAGPGQLNLAAWFRDPWPFNDWQADLTWSRSVDHWRLDIDHLNWQSPELTFQAAARLQQSTDAASPFLDAHARLQRADFGQIAHYIPLHIVPANAAHWLERAFVSGQLNHGDAWWHGALADFPYDDGSGLFYAHAHTDQAVLRFADDWPVLADLQAELSFAGAGLAIGPATGTLAGLPVDPVVVDIDRMSGNGVLRLAGRVVGRTPHALTLFRQTPQAPIVAAFDRHASLDGEAAVDLLLDYPFAADHLHHSGEIRLFDGRITVPAATLAVDDINGSVRFNDALLSDGHFWGRAFNEAVQIHLNSTSTQLNIGVDGQADSAELRAWQAGPWWNGLDGRLGYQAQVRLPSDWVSAQGGLGLGIQADLKHLAVDWPAPLGKTANQAGRFNLQTDWLDDTVTLSADYDAGLAVRTRLNKTAQGWSAPAGDVALGRALPDSLGEGWRFYAKADALPLDAWWQRLQAFGAGSAAGHSALRWRSVDVNLHAPTWGTRNFGPLALNLHQINDSWEGTVDGRIASGQLNLPASWPANRPLQLTLERLSLPDELGKSSDTPATATTEDTSSNPPDPQRWPALNVQSTQLMWRDQNLGRFDCQIEHAGEGLQSGPCSVTADDAQLNWQATWQRQGGQDSTHLDGKLTSPDLGQWLQRFKLSDAVIGTPTDLQFDLNWNTAPTRATAARLNGELAIKLGEGALRHVEPGVGRALGLFNIDTLIKRRLLLDFSDVFDEGWAYDEVTGRFRVKAGVVSTHNFAIDGPAARLLLSGTLDLPTRQLNSAVTVIPRTSLTLPLLALAGGPAVSGAVFLAQRLVGDKLEGITASQYQVQGRWDHPDIKLVSRNTPLQLLQRAWAGMTDAYQPESEESPHE